MNQLFFKYCLLSLILLLTQCQNAQDMNTIQINDKLYENLDTALAEADKVALLSLSFHNQELNKFPDLTMFKHLQHFIWAQESIEIDYDFSKSPQIKSLSFSFCDLNNENTTFKNLHKIDSLEDLTFYKNLYSKFPKVLNTYPFLNLKQLSVKKNPIKNVNGVWLDNCSNLEELHLSWNEIQVISNDIDKLQKLKVLMLSHNNITELPKNFGNLKNLERLSLQENKLQILPKTFGNLKKLEELNLSENEFKVIPEEVFELENLTSLDLRSNQIIKISNSIKNLKNLTALYMGDNQIAILPNELFELENLINLSLWRNQLTEIPKGIQNFKKLEALSVGKNYDISHLPKFLIEMKTLKELHIEKTNIPLEEVEAFKAARPDVYVQY